MNDSEYDDYNAGQNVVYDALFFTALVPVWLTNVVGNTLVLICVFREKKLHRASYYLIASLAFADLSSAVVSAAPLTFVALSSSPLACDAIAQFYLLCPSNICASVSFLNLLLLTAERYCAIAFPIPHRNIVTTRRAFGTIIFIWIFCTVLSGVNSFPFFSRRVDYQSTPFCPPFTSEFAAMASSIAFVGNAVLIYLNIHFWILLRRRSRNVAIREMPLENGMVQRNALNHEATLGTKTSKAVSIIVVFFVACWLPNTVFCLLVALSYRVRIHLGLLRIYFRLFILLFVVNGAFNPVIYVSQNPHLRSAFKKLLGPICRSNRVGVEATT